MFVFSSHCQDLIPTDHTDPNNQVGDESEPKKKAGSSSTVGIVVGVLVPLLVLSILVLALVRFRCGLLILSIHTDFLTKLILYQIKLRSNKRKQRMSEFNETAFELQVPINHDIARYLPNPFR